MREGNLKIGVLAKNFEFLMAVKVRLVAPWKDHLIHYIVLSFELQ
jgi:hypothetical protein